MAQIIPIVSDALQSTIRRLLPSQRGFGEDLQAQNVIVPIIDLTPTAEGSILGTNLQTALSFDSQTPFAARDNSVVVANTPGFYRIFGVCSGESDSVASDNGSFTMSNGISVKTIWRTWFENTATDSTYALEYDFVVFLATGDSITAVSSSTNVRLTGSSRQIADVSGVNVNPAGFIGE